MVRKRAYEKASRLSPVAPEEYMNEAYRVAGIYVHKSMLAVVVTDLSGAANSISSSASSELWTAI
jgi:hypothetical protein